MLLKCWDELQDSLTIPRNVNTFYIHLIDYETTFYVSRVKIFRKDLVDNELSFDGPSKLWGKVSFDNSKKPKKELKNNFNPLVWSLYPDIDIIPFDPDAPLRFSVGLEANGRFRVHQSTFIQGSLKNAIISTIDDLNADLKGLPNVRSDFMYYHKDIGNSIMLTILL